VSTRFLGLDFRPIRLEDKAALRAHLERHPQRISGYSFASLAAWAGPLGFRWARLDDDCVLVLRPFGASGELHLLQPLGDLSLPAAWDLLARARRLPYALKLLSVSKEFLASNLELAARFSSVEDRAGSNYLYLAKDLAELPGRRYAKKRNLVSQFEEAYPDWQAEPIDAACGPHCRNVLLAMAHGLGVDETDPSLRQELHALEFTVRHLEAVEQDGLLIRVQGEPVAFSLFERLDAEVAAVHFEKAIRAYKGLYQVVNRESARRIAATGARLVNREEDLGDQGLRQAKLSYHPIEICPVYDLTLLPEGSKGLEPEAMSLGGVPRYTPSAPTGHGPGAGDAGLRDQETE
jgi:hypothetical protein